MYGSMVDIDAPLRLKYAVKPDRQRRSVLIISSIDFSPKLFCVLTYYLADLFGVIVPINPQKGPTMSAIDEIAARLASSVVGVSPLVRVLRAIARGDADGSALTRATLSETLDLSPATISKAVTDLVNRSMPLVAENDGRPGGGRKQKLLSLNDEKYSVVGIRIEDSQQPVTRIVGAETRLDGIVLAETTRELSGDDPATVVAELADLAHDMITTAQHRPRTVLAVAIQLGGQIHKGRVIRSVNSAWDGLDLGPKLQAELGLTTIVENEVTSLIVLDHLRTQHTARWPNRALVRLFDDGVGSALVLGGLVYRGSHGLASELGHVRVDYAKTAPKCRCGQRGCLDAQATPSAIRAAVASGRSIEDAYAAAGTALGRALVNLIHVVDVGHIRLLVPEDYQPSREPAAQRFHDTLDTELGRLFSPDVRPDIAFDYYDPKSVAAMHASAMSAVAIEALIDRIFRKD
jgi:predicted NBD/HSP70 family sugar kinase